MERPFGYSTEGYSPHDTDMEYGGGQVYTGSPTLLRNFDFVVEGLVQTDSMNLQLELKKSRAVNVRDDSFHFSNGQLRFIVSAKSEGEARALVQAAGSSVAGDRREFSQLGGSGLKYMIKDGRL